MIRAVLTYVEYCALGLCRERRPHIMTAHRLLVLCIRIEVLFHVGKIGKVIRVSRLVSLKASAPTFCFVVASIDRGLAQAHSLSRIRWFRLCLGCFLGCEEPFQALLAFL